MHAISRFGYISYWIIVPLRAGQRWRFSGRGGSVFMSGVAQLFNCLYIRNGLSHAPRTFTIRLSIPNSTTYGVIIFGRTSPLKLNTSSFNGWGKTGGGIREFIPLMTLARRCLDVKRSANFFFNITFNKVWKLLSPVHGGILRGALSSSPWEAH